MLTSAWIGATQRDPFFWDTIQLASKHAHFFYDNQLRWALLPPEIDSGHPPVFGYYIALIWHWFGKSLPASHWAMWPFLFGICILVYRLGARVLGEARAYMALPVILLDPVMAGQSALVSPDIALVCGFLMAVEGILGRKNGLTAAGSLLLCCISLRGMMTAGALAVWYGYLRYRKGRAAVPGALAVAAGAIPALLFLAWHYRAAGWIGAHGHSSWAPAFERVGAEGFIRNCFVLAWRWLDFGRIFEWGVVAYAWYKTRRIPTDSSPWLPLSLALFVALSAAALLYANLSAHRYFLPAYIAFHLYALSLPARMVGSAAQRLALTAVLVVGLASGNLWINPPGVSMDWDATLAHRPYHALRAEALAYLKASGPLSDVGTAFPAWNSGEMIELNGDTAVLPALDLSRNKRVLASNVFNDMERETLDILEKSWRRAYRKERFGVWVAVYELNGERLK